MPRRLFALLAGLSMVTTGCGGAGTNEATPAADRPSAPSSAQRIDETAAARAFESLADLDDAWRERDCATVAGLTVWVEKTLGGRACQATRNGRPAPARRTHSEPEFLIPEKDDDWFAVLAAKPEPAYFVFLRNGSDWLLGAGPVPVVADLPADTQDGSDPATARRARLVPQRHLTYLTDPIGVSGVRFPDDDPVRDLRDNLAARPAQVRPDRLTVDVELLGTPRTIALPSGSMLVFHTLRLTFGQRASGSALTHPLYGSADVKAFTGRSRLAKLTGVEIVTLVSELTPANKVRTVAMRRDLADVRP